ncbi:MAG: leucine-rich repeat protein [Muribaculaceae bacterium]|nr:leucine-rich repeat protein [Muribaculaceae bacterium]
MKDFGERPYNPKRVKTVTVNEGITSLGDNSLADCTELTEVSLPSTLKSIGKGAFRHCSSLSEINIPSGVENIGAKAFENCTSLRDIDLPGSVRYIGAQAFKDCKKLNTLRIPVTIEQVGAKAFEKCNDISVIYELPEFINTQTAGYYCLPAGIVAQFYDTDAEKSSAVQGLPTPTSVVNANISNETPNPVISVPVAEITSESPGTTTYVADDVDLKIPFTHRSNDKTYAVIISNENYPKMENVPFAIHDGDIFNLYCQRTLGIPRKNIFMYTDATSGVIKEAIEDLKTANRIEGAEMKVIFYYSGHGAPDENNHESYLIPTDASRVSPAVCIPLSYLYDALADLDVESAVVFIDACFSGGERNGGMLMASNGHRGVKLAPKKEVISGNVVVFSATNADQTALPYAEKGHGMFTYFLLKKINETRGNTSLSELESYLRDNVNQSAFRINRREQTPTVSVSPAVAEKWQIWRLNQ